MLPASLWSNILYLPILCFVFHINILYFFFEIALGLCPPTISRASGCKVPALGKSLEPRGVYFPIHPSSRQCMDSVYLYFLYFLLSKVCLQYAYAFCIIHLVVRITHFLFCVVFSILYFRMHEGPFCLQALSQKWHLATIVFCTDTFVFCISIWVFCV